MVGAETGLTFRVGSGVWFQNEGRKLRNAREAFREDPAVSGISVPCVPATPGLPAAGAGAWQPPQPVPVSLSVTACRLPFPGLAYSRAVGAAVAHVLRRRGVGFKKGSCARTPSWTGRAGVWAQDGTPGCRGRAPSRHGPSPTCPRSPSVCWALGGPAGAGLPSRLQSTRTVLFPTV